MGCGVIVQAGFIRLKIGPSGGCVNTSMNLSLDLIQDEDTGRFSRKTVLHGVNLVCSTKYILREFPSLS
jgi:hypothetical protein